MHKKLLYSLVILFVLLGTLIYIDFEPLQTLDNNVNSYLSTIHYPTLDKLMLYITKIGNTYESLLIFIVLSFFIITKNKKYLFYIFTISTALATILPLIIKNLIQKIRPVSDLLQETDFSFPSGHTTISIIFIIASIIIIVPLIKNKFYKYFYLITSFCIFSLVVFSRLYLSVHWFSDILGGILLGTTCYLLSIVFCCQKKENML